MYRTWPPQQLGRQAFPQSDPVQLKRTIQQMLAKFPDERFAAGRHMDPRTRQIQGPGMRFNPSVKLNAGSAVDDWRQRSKLLENLIHGGPLKPASWPDLPRGRTYGPTQAFPVRGRRLT